MITESDKNLWDFDSNEYYRVITTNGNVKKNGEAVMGKGIALQAALKYPELPCLLADHLKKFGNEVYLFENLKIMTFPTKENWKEKSTYELIAKSCDALMVLYNIHNIGKIVMPKVGCSNGGLEWSKVRQLLYRKFDGKTIDITIARI